MENRMTDEVDQLIDLGSRGHYPLFYIEDLKLVASKAVPVKTTRKYMKDFVRNVLRSVERHHSFERKKDALSQLQREDKEKFISYFVKLVEHHGLNQNIDLH